jgi:hypothetical protein
MQHAIKYADLTPEDRIAVEKLLGRPMQLDEAIEVIAHKDGESIAELEAARRKQAVVRLRDMAKGKRLNGTTVRELIDEGRRF